MPRDYARKTNRQAWSQQSMKKAIEAVQENRMGWLAASKTFGVPQATLRRHALNANKTILPNTKGLGSFKCTFTPETRLFGLTRKAVQELAFNLAEMNGIQHNFNKEKKRAGQEWLDGFLKRNQDISLRTPEPTSAARAQAFNKPQVAKFFQEYQKLVNDYNFPPQRIYNVDESGLTTVQKPQKIIATKGRKQVGSLTSAERGSNVTVVCCTNAIGSFIPPCMIFPRKNMKNELVDEAPTGTLGLAQETGWMTAEIFVKWLKHFQKHTKSSIDDPVLLVCDGHASHKSFEAVTYAKENGIAMLCLPPHCTHRMQPLDVSIYGPLKTYFHQEISKWLKNHPGRVVTHLQMGQLFTEAYGKSATIQNATNGFKKTGLWPINPDIFPEYMFAPAETTNIPLNHQTDAAQILANAPPSALQMHGEDATDDGQIPDSSIEQHIINAEATPSPSVLQMDGEATDNDGRAGSSMEQNMVNAEATLSPSILQMDGEATDIEDRAGTSMEQNMVNAAPDERPDSSMEQKAKSSLIFTVETISPAPQGPYIQGQGLRKQKTRKHHWHLTSTPNLIELKAKNTPKAPSKEKKRKVKKTLFEIPSTSGKQEIKAKMSTRKKKRVEKKIDSDDESSHENTLLSDIDDEDDCPCIYCNDLYSRLAVARDFVRVEFVIPPR